MKRCTRCHRVLTDSRAIEIGMGKICYEKTFGKSFPRDSKTHFPTLNKAVVLYSNFEQLSLYDEMKGDEANVEKSEPTTII